MIEDEVVKEVRAAREAFAAAHGFDIRKMVAALHELGVASGRELVRLESRPTIVTERSASPTNTTSPLEDSQLIVESTSKNCP